MAMEHLRTLTGDPDILYKHMANYALRLSSNPGGARAYVADLEEPEEDEMAPRPDGEEEPEEDEPEPEPEPEPGPEGEEGEGDGEEKPVVFDYLKMFYRYVSSASGIRGEDGEWVVGKKLERGEGVSFKLIDNTPQAPWVDIDNCLTYVGPERTIPLVEGEEAPPPAEDEEDGPKGETVAFLKGFPRVGAYFAVPIKLATGEIAGMLCMDTLKGPAGGSGRPISGEDKDLLREVAHNASLALNAAAEMRAAKLALAEEEQAAIAEALAATDDPKPELADGEEPPPEPEPEPEEPEAPQDGEDKDDAALRVNIAKTRKALEAAKANLSRKQKRFTAVDALLDGVDDEALLEIRSLQRAPKYTWKALKAALWLTGHKKYEFQTWALTRKLIGDDKIIKEFKDIDPLEMTLTDKARQGSRKCLRGIRDANIVKESKTGAVFYRWCVGFTDVAVASHEVKSNTEALAEYETEQRQRAEKKAAGGGGEAEEAPAEEAPAE